MNIILIILLYCLIGAIVEFLLVFGVLMYSKRHSKSDEQFIKAWNKVSDIALVVSLYDSCNDIKDDVAFALKLHVCLCTIIWPFHLIILILVRICIIVGRLANYGFNKLTSFLLKR